MLRNSKLTVRKWAYINLEIIFYSGNLALWPNVLGTLPCVKQSLNKLTIAMRWAYLMCSIISICILLTQNQLKNSTNYEASALTVTVICEQWSSIFMALVLWLWFQVINTSKFWTDLAGQQDFYFLWRGNGNVHGEQITTIIDRQIRCVRLRHVVEMTNSKNCQYWSHRGQTS